MKRFAVLLAGLILIIGGMSCSTRHFPKQASIHLTGAMVKHIWIDANFSKEEVESIIRAYKTIECSTNYSIVRLDFITGVDVEGPPPQGMFDDQSVIVTSTTSRHKSIIEADKQFKKEGGGKHTAGLCLTGQDLSFVLMPRDRIYSSKMFYMISVHEAIHCALGVHVHAESAGAIMFPAIDETSAKDMTEDDLKFICEIYQCDASNLKICRGQ